MRRVFQMATMVCLLLLPMVAAYGKKVTEYAVMSFTPVSGASARAASYGDYKVRLLTTDLEYEPIPDVPIAANSIPDGLSRAAVLGWEVTELVGMMSDGSIVFLVEREREIDLSTITDTGLQKLAPRPKPARPDDDEPSKNEEG